MSNRMLIGRGAAGFAALAALGAAGTGMSQDLTPPPWSALTRCAEMPADDARLSCYDAAMRAAGYQPKPEATAAEHRRRFGLSLPQISILKKKDREQGAEEGAQAAAAPSAAPAARAEARAAPPPPVDEDKATVELEKIAVQGNGKLLMITTDGQIWEQTELGADRALAQSGLRDADPAHAFRRLLLRRQQVEVRALQARPLALRGSNEWPAIRLSLAAQVFGILRIGPQTDGNHPFAAIH